MKSLLLAFLAALLLAGLVLSPASAAAACGDTYTVQKGDYLTLIARTCGVTYTSLVQVNPEIKDVNKIFTGQVIRIKASATLPTSTNYTVVKGDTLFKIATKYGTTVAELLKMNPAIKNASIIYTGQVIKIPANSGSTGTVPMTGSGITLSTANAKPGAVIDVTVKGFPANAEIDLRLGKDGQGFSVVVDGKTNASGGAAAKVTIPSMAKSGEKWVVQVLTTEIRNGKDVKSPLITITQ